MYYKSMKDKYGIVVKASLLTSIDKLVQELVQDEDFQAEVDEEGIDPKDLPHRWKEVRHLLEPFDRKAKIRVYRAVNLSSLDELDLDELGCSWSFEEDAAHSWYGGGGEKYILVADLPKSSVDLETTARQLIIHQHDEKEIRAEVHSRIYLLEIKKNGKVLNKFSPPLVTKTGSSMFGHKA